MTSAHQYEASGGSRELAGGLVVNAGGGSEAELIEDPTDAIMSPAAEIDRYATMISTDSVMAYVCLSVCRRLTRQI